ncbi:MAG TPA: M20/M25/M40 family metallo-hydrolase, partial [Candidatus Omnitrophota bacterium]|nr:M20/M25/M40 family metallo-hydrolase [Candidatus Omnitrophota bacterium]
MKDSRRLSELLTRLLKINSENPPGDERKVAAFTSAFLKKYGLKTKVFSYSRGRDNVLAVLPGSKPKKDNKPLLITPHLDTVPAGTGWKFKPFAATLRSGKIYGRGASDCKCNVAVAMEVMARLAESGFRPQDDVIFLATADEETGSQKGLKPFLDKTKIKFAHALILDADEFDIITAQKGLMHFKVTVKGKRAHGAYPERGINAIERACSLIGILKDIKLGYKEHALLKPPTINIGTIHGGDKVNMVADWCEFEVDLRFLPGMSSSMILSEIKKAFKETGFDHKIVISDIQEPYEI